MQNVTYSNIFSMVDYLLQETWFQTDIFVKIALLNIDNINWQYFLLFYFGLCGQLILI